MMKARRFRVGDKVLIVHDEPPQSWVGMQATVTDVDPFPGAGLFDYEITLDDGTSGFFDEWELDDATDPITKL